MRLQLDQLIANTTFGHVFRGTDPNSGAVFAVKQYTHECYEAAAELHVSEVLRNHPQHPHLVHMLGNYYSGGCAHLVFEFCEKGDLYDLLAKQSRFPRREALAYFEQVVSAIQHLHSIGFAHRDISLENILVDNKDTVKLCDFGLAFPTAVRSNATVGKPFYMAPEVFAGVEYDPAAADMWSLGVLFFVLVTGMPIFSVPSEQDAGYRVLARQGIKSLLELWHLKMLFTKEQLHLLDGLLQVNPRKRLKINQIGANLQPKCTWRRTFCKWF
ncbi:protein kinase [Achlya hypogyna]|uniref:Protein kinase n=1 Tax=Achlya hypogyna TaxID=1202772 RepID=A0A1V9YET9_ACHHY|nr:protein kinase [Achlya hypogyna]